MATIDLVPVMSTLHHMSRWSLAPITAAVRHEQLAVLVVIESPLIAAAVGEDLELMPGRMVSLAPRRSSPARRCRREYCPAAGW